MASLMLTLGRLFTWTSHQASVHLGQRLTPRIGAILLASCLALPGARADGWRGGGDGWRYRGGFPSQGSFFRGGGFRAPYAYGRPLGWNRGWRNGGYWGYRPWASGWTNWSPNSWSWWGPNALGLGVIGLATGAVITGLVNNAAQNRSTVILVPDSAIRLDFASVLPAGDGVVSFRYIVGTTGPAFQGNGDCRQGLFNGQQPRSVADAQLLNSACHLAYGSGSNRAPAADGGF